MNGMDSGAMEVFLDAYSTGDPSGAIERQEARGQRQVAALSQLPCDSPWDKLEQLGIKRLEDGDGVLCRAQLPEGWQIVPTDHAMWSRLVDEKGRERAGMFYKAAFYDRSAHLHLTRRYTAQVRPVGGWEAQSGKFEGVILDSETVIYTHPQVVTEPPFDAQDRKPYMAYLDTEDTIQGELNAELRTRYPDHENPLAYWDA
jgi:hypothetical protein